MADLDPVCVHEAGHALAAHALDDEVRLLTLDDVSGSGSALIGPGVGNPLPIDGWVAAVNVLDATKRAHALHRRLWVTLAGPAADHLLEGRHAWDGRQDFRVVHAVCMELETPPWHVFPRIQARLQEPAAWAAVETLAAELDRSHRVEGSRAGEILTAHVPRGLWLSELPRND